MAIKRRVPVSAGNLEIEMYSLGLFYILKGTECSVLSVENEASVLNTFTAFLAVCFLF